MKEAKPHCHLISAPKGEPATSGLHALLALLILRLIEHLQLCKSVRPEKPGMLQEPPFPQTKQVQFLQPLLSELSFRLFISFTAPCTHFSKIREKFLP